MQFRIQRFERVDSTNERALCALASGAAQPGDVFVARVQEAGRGRLGRRWWDEPGASLCCSIVLGHEPPLLPAPALTMLGGLVVRDALVGLGLGSAQLKWPNDVLARGAKLCGILVEARGLDPDAPRHVLGVGINVRQRAFSPELEAERAVTSLALEGLELSLEAVLEALLARLGPWCERLGPQVPRRRAEALEDLEQRYAAALGLVGAEVELRASNAVHRGRLAALSLRGAELELERGRVHFALEHLASLRGIDAIADSAADAERGAC